MTYGATRHTDDSEVVSPWLTCADAAVYLGSGTASGIRGLVASGDLRPDGLGLNGAMLFLTETLDAYARRRLDAQGDSEQPSGRTDQPVGGRSPEGESNGEDRQDRHISKKGRPAVGAGDGPTPTDRPDQRGNANDARARDNRGCGRDASTASRQVARGDDGAVFLRVGRRAARGDASHAAGRAIATWDPLGTR